MSNQLYLYPGVTLDTLPPVTTRRMIDQGQLLKQLDGLRAELERAAAADGKTVNELRVSAGLLLEDIRAILEG